MLDPCSLAVKTAGEPKISSSSQSSLIHFERREKKVGRKGSTPNSSSIQEKGLKSILCVLIAISGGN